MCSRNSGGLGYHKHVASEVEDGEVLQIYQSRRFITLPSTFPRIMYQIHRNGEKESESERDESGC